MSSKTMRALPRPWYIIPFPYRRVRREPPCSSRIKIPCPRINQPRLTVMFVSREAERRWVIADKVRCSIYPQFSVFFENITLLQIFFFAINNTLLFYLFVPHFQAVKILGHIVALIPIPMEFLMLTLGVAKNKQSRKNDTFYDMTGVNGTMKI